MFKEPTSNRLNICRESAFAAVRGTGGIIVNIRKEGLPEKKRSLRKGDPRTSKLMGGVFGDNALYHQEGNFEEVGRIETAKLEK